MGLCQNSDSLTNISCFYKFGSFRVYSFDSNRKMGMLLLKWINLPSRYVYIALSSEKKNSGRVLESRGVELSTNFLDGKCRKLAVALAGI